MDKKFHFCLLCLIKNLTIIPLAPNLPDVTWTPHAPHTKERFAFAVSLNLSND